MAETPLEEGKERFVFGDAVEALKLDDSDLYREGPGRIPGIRCVDFVACGADHLLLVEAKDFRAHRIENKEKVGSKLADQVAQKVVGALATAVAGRRTLVDEPRWVRVASVLDSEAKDIVVLLWLRRDRGTPQQELRAKVRRQNLSRLLKTRLRWLTRRVMVVGPEQLPQIQRWGLVRVEGLPGAGQPG